MADSAVNPLNSGAVALDTSENQASTSTPSATASIEIFKGEIINQLFVQIQEITQNPTPLTPEQLRLALRGSAHLGWYVRQRLHHGTISGRESAKIKNFEQLAFELVGRNNWHTVPVVLQALAGVMHDILNGDPKLSEDALSRGMQCFEEGGIPEPDDLMNSGKDSDDE